MRADRGPRGEDVPTRELVARAQRGDTRAFEQLYRRQVGRIYAICLRLIADPVQAEILTQDAFVRAWEKLGKYSGRGAFAGWLRRLAVNVVIEDRRAAARWRQWMEPLPDPDRCGRGTGTLAEARQGIAVGGGVVAPASIEDAIDLERAIATLPPGARLAFVLHDVEGYRHHEIAAMTDLAVGTIKSQVHRARELLRRVLGEAQEVTGA